MPENTGNLVLCTDDNFAEPTLAATKEMMMTRFLRALPIQKAAGISTLEFF